MHPMLVVILIDIIIVNVLIPGQTLIDIDAEKLRGFDLNITSPALQFCDEIEIEQHCCFRLRDTCSLLALENSEIVRTTSSEFAAIDREVSDLIEKLTSVSCAVAIFCRYSVAVLHRG